MKNKTKLVLAVAALCTVALVVGVIIFESADLTVTFDLNYSEASGAPDEQKIERGGLAEEPESPERDGYHFVGWFTERQPESLEGKFVFEDTPVKKSICLYAVWRLDSAIFAEYAAAAGVDTDGDRLSDEYEDKIGTDKNKPDTDGDGADDYTEVVILAYDPKNPDTDGNGVLDGIEDADGDGLTNGKEQDLGTHPLLSDTDFDGVDDCKEIELAFDPLKSDTDGDGAKDGYELDNGTDAKVADSFFTETASAGVVGENGDITVTVEALVKGDIAGTVSVRAVADGEYAAISRTVPGYMGNTFELKAAGDIESAEVTFEYDSSVWKTDDGFKPGILYFNEQTGTFEIVESHLAEDGKIVAKLEHFSFYAPVNMAEYETRNKDHIPHDPSKSSYHIKDHYEDICNGKIPLLDGSYKFVGYDLSVNNDYDGDGLKNSEEISIVVSPDGFLAIRMISDPTLEDSDLDGIPDGKDVLPLEFSLSGPADLRALMNNDLFASSLMCDQIYGNSSKYTWNEMFSALGVLDHGTQKAVFKEVWLEYMASYCDNFLSEAKAMEYIKIESTSYLAAIDSITNEIVDFQKNWLANPVNDVALDTHIKLLRTRRDALRAKDYAAYVDYAKDHNWAVRIKKNTTELVPETLSTTVEFIGITFSAANELKDTWDKVAEMNANMEIYNSCVAIFRDIYNTQGADDAARKAAGEMMIAFSENASDFSRGFWAGLDDKATQYTWKIIYNAASLVLNTTPVGKAVQWSAELLVGLGTDRAYAQNQVIANEYMLRGAASLLYDSIQYKDGVYLPKANADTTVVYSLLSHICNLRLNGERLYSSIRDSKEYIMGKVDDVTGYADGVGVSISQTLVDKCKLLGDPNVMLKLTHDGNSEVQPDFYIYVNGVQQAFVKHFGNKYEMHLDSGKAYNITVLGVWGKELWGVHQVQKTVTIKAGEENKIEIHVPITNQRVRQHCLHVEDKDTGMELIGTTFVFRNKNGSGNACFYWNNPNGLHGDISTNIYIPEGDYTVQISKPGYTALTTQLSVSPSFEVKHMTFKLSKDMSGTVVGKVVDVNGKPVAGAAVAIVTADGAFVSSGHSGTGGEFSLGGEISSLKTYYIRCAANSFKETQKKAYVNGAPSDNTVVLEPLVDPNAAMLGSGTAEDPYQVRTAQHLDMVRNDLKAHYIQMNDIDLSVFENFLPIGVGNPRGISSGSISKDFVYVEAWFEGSFDGNGYKITGLKIYQNEMDCVGLFSGAGEKSRLVNINVENATVVIDKLDFDYAAFYEKYGTFLNVNAGVLVGRTYGELENCTVSGELVVKNACRAMVGGVAGRASKIVKCDSRVNINAEAHKNYRFSNVFGEVYCGGIVGYTNARFTSISKCRNYGEVVANAGRSVYVGGISGHMGTVTDCINYGNILGRSDHDKECVKTDFYIGGISGDAYGASLINCINLGNIKAECVAGSAKEFVIRAGGIAGIYALFGDGKVQDCINACREITYEVVEKTDSSGNPIEYELKTYLNRISTSNTSRMSNNYSLDDTRLHGDRVREYLGHNDVNGENMPNREFDRRLAELVAKIEQ